MADGRIVDYISIKQVIYTSTVPNKCHMFVYIHMYRHTKIYLYKYDFRKIGYTYFSAESTNYEGMLDRNQMHVSCTYVKFGGGGAIF
jgi:hypothetical protein